MSFSFERRLLDHYLALVPWLAMSNFGCGFHDRLPSS